MTPLIDKLIEEQSAVVRKMGLDPTNLDHWDVAIEVVQKTKQVSEQGVSPVN